MTKVSEAMHAGIDCVEPAAPLDAIAKIMRDRDIGAVPVRENGQLVGMITDRDLALRGFGEGSASGPLTAGAIMSQPLLYCRADEDVADAIRIMEDHEIRRLPVLDEAQQAIGMLSLGDVSHCGHRDLAAEVIAAVSGHHA